MSEILGIPVTPELVGTAIAAAIPSLLYGWRCWLAARERQAQRTAILSAAGHPEVLAALSKLELPPLDGRGPVALLWVAAAAGTLAATFTLWGPVSPIPSAAAGVRALSASRCTAQDCKPPAYCAAGVCQAEAKPPAQPAPAHEPDPSAPAPEPALPPAPGRGARPRRDDDEAPVGPSSSYARAPWEETLPGWRPPWALGATGESL